MSGRIQALDSASVQRICSAQVVVDLAIAVKELLENSLDANATAIGVFWTRALFVSLIRSDVKVREYGLEMVEVTDNGSGIDPADYEMLSTL